MPHSHHTSPPSSAYSGLPFDTLSTVTSAEVFHLLSIITRIPVIPQIFKTAAVTPFLKNPGSDPDSPENYRPISNLNNISKILQCLFIARIQQHVTTCPNFNYFQSAYQPQYSTETALLHTLNSIYSSADRSQPTLLVCWILVPP